MTNTCSETLVKHSETYATSHKKPTLNDIGVLCFIERAFCEMSAIVTDFVADLKEFC